MIMHAAIRTPTQAPPQHRNEIFSCCSIQMSKLNTFLMKMLIEMLKFQKLWCQ